MATLRGEVLERIKKLTGSNNQTAARVLGAQMLGDMKLAKKFELVEKLERLEGALPDLLVQYRNILHGDLMTLAKQKMSPRDYTAFKSAY